METAQLVTAEPVDRWLSAGPVCGSRPFVPGCGPALCGAALSASLSGGTIPVVSEEVVPAASFGTGVYSFSEAARILVHRDHNARAATLRRWVSDGLTPPTFGRVEGGAVLSFHDLLSLEVVRRFRAKGISLQKLRALEQVLRERHPGVARPFAHELFFTDGVAIWMEQGPEDGPSLVEVVGRRPGQYAWRPAIETFADEVRYSPEGEALSWSLTERIEIDPRLQFGVPVVKGTRLPISVIARELAGHTPEQIADWHAVEVEDVRDVRDFLAA